MITSSSTYDFWMEHLNYLLKTCALKLSERLVSPWGEFIFCVCLKWDVEEKEQALVKTQLGCS